MLSNLDQKKFILCAELCDLAYDLSTNFESAKSKVLSETHSSPENFKWFDIKATSTQAFLVSNNSAIFLIFQGSATPEDWAINGFFELKGYLSGNAHRGFLYAVEQTFKEIFGAIQSELNKNPKRPLIISGHSLGGALAMLYGAKLRENKIEEIEIVTFGQPRCGNIKFIESFAKLNIPYTRFINKEDKVPDVPPPFGRNTWSHGGNGYLLSSDNAIQGVENESPEKVFIRFIEFLFGFLPFYKNGKLDMNKVNEYIANINHSMKVYKIRLASSFQTGNSNSVATEDSRIVIR